MYLPVHNNVIKHNITQSEKKEIHFYAYYSDIFFMEHSLPLSYYQFSTNIQYLNAGFIINVTPRRNAYAEVCRSKRDKGLFETQ